MDDEMTAAQVEALTDAATGDREVLVAFLLERFGRWPWWDSAWRVVTIREVESRQIESRLHHVTVEGAVGPDAHSMLPLSVFLRVAGSQVDRFQAQVGDALIGPPIRHDDPHPFGAILSALMDRRGITRKELARRCGLAESTIAKMRAGYTVPRERHRVDDLAAALDMPVDDLVAIVGMPADA